MCNWRKFLIQIFILLLIRVSQIRSNCSWNDEHCTLKCNSKNNVWPLGLKTVATIMTNLSKIWMERHVCHEDGIDLRLENIKYPGNIVAFGFFTANIKVRTLTIKLNFMLDKSETIETDAFRGSGALKFLKELVISNAMFDPIKKGTFNGLDCLEALTIDGRQLRVIESGVLDALNGTLKEFSLEQSESFNSNKEILIDGLTGAGSLEQLETIKFKYNLKTSIGRGTFAGVTNVKRLDLSDCQIEAIAVGSFDSLNFLETLQLKNNYLATIPDGFFNNILIRSTTQIFLEGNEFVCDCTLMPFKMSLIEHSNFIGPLDCYKPDKFNGYKIIDTPFDDETCVPPTTSSSTSSSTSTTLSPSPALECHSSDEFKTVSIDPPVHKMQVYQTGDGDVMLRVDILAENSVLVWFNMDDPITNLTESVNINCLIGSERSERTFHIDNLVTNSVYTICIMEPMEVTNSPLDCVSFVKRSDANEMIEPWLFLNAKSSFIGIAFVVCIISVILGSAIGGLTYKVKCLMMSRKEPFIRSYQSSQCSMRRSRMSLMTRRTTNTTVQYFINGNVDGAPPLPARPISMYLMDEPVYATIRDIRSIWPTPTQAADNLHASNELELQVDNLQASNELELQVDNLQAPNELELQVDNLQASNELELQVDNLQASNELELQNDNLQATVNQLVLPCLLK